MATQLSLISLEGEAAAIGKGTLTPILGSANLSPDNNGSGYVIGVEGKRESSIPTLLRVLFVLEEKFLLENLIANAQNEPDLTKFAKVDKLFVSVQSAINLYRHGELDITFECHPFLSDGILLGLEKLNLRKPWGYYKLEYANGEIRVCTEYPINLKLEGAIVFRL